MSSCAKRSLTIPLVTLSGTSSPLSMNDLARTPISVLFAIAVRNISPVEM